MINKKSVCVTLVLFFLFLSGAASSMTKGLEAISLQPATDGGPYIGVWGSHNLDQAQFELGTLAVYAYRPFQLTSNGTRIRGILDHTLVEHFYGQVGLIDRWLSLGLDIPVGWWTKFIDPDDATAQSQNKFVVGDIYVNLKSELIRTKYFGLALRPFMSIPDGYGKEFFGNGNVTGGGTLIAELKPFDVWSMSLNAGIQGRKTYYFRDIKESSQLQLGFGTAVQITKPVSIVAEITSSARLADPFEKKVESPAEFRGAVKWAIGKTGLLASLGGGAGIVRGSGAPTFDIFAGLSFSPSRREHHARLMKEDFNIRDYTVYFPVNSYSVTDSKEAKKICDLSDKIRDNKKVKIKVIGHTDSTGSKMYNEKLSKKRAEKVSWFLTLLGIDNSRIIVEALGVADPVGDNSTKEGRAKNRRVDFNTVK